MTHGKSSEPSTPERRGRLSEALIGLFMKRANVVSSETLSPGFHLIALRSPQFIAIPWTPGQKLQIAIGSAFVARTFTPVEWDAREGETRIVAYAHGDGPGSDWIRAAKPGDACAVRGPRASLDMNRVQAPCVVFGDETSFGLALANGRQRDPGETRYLFEVNRAEAAQPVLDRLALNNATLFTRRPNDQHLRDIEAQLGTPAAAGASFVLTGKATSIQSLRRVLKALAVPAARVTTKAYWAPGKTGLD